MIIVGVSVQLEYLSHEPVSQQCGSIFYAIRVIWGHGWGPSLYIEAGVSNSKGFHAELTLESRLILTMSTVPVERTYCQTTPGAIGCARVSSRRSAPTFVAHESDETTCDSELALPDVSPSNERCKTGSVLVPNHDRAMSLVQGTLGL